MAFRFGLQTASRLLTRPAAACSVQPVQRTLHLSPALLKIISFNLADIGEGIAEAMVLKWHVKEGDHVKEFDKLCDVQSDKATVDITSRYDGEIVKLHYKEDELAIVGKPLIDLDVADDVHAEPSAQRVAADTTIAEDSAPAFQAGSETPTVQGSTKVPMAPSVRRLIKENGLDITLITASGRNGRVLKEDVLNFLSRGGASSSPAASTAPSTATRVMPLGEDKVLPITGVQKAMVKSMTAALKVPQFGYADEYELDALMKVRSSLKDAALKRGVKLSYMPFIIKAASLALRDFPVLNAHVNEDCTQITHRAAHNIGVAMDTPSGLIVPNVKNVESKSILEIAQELNQLQELGKANKLTSTHLTGGTFSLSNIGVVGGTYLSPVVVVPEVCIGGLGRLRKVPRFDANDNVIPVHIMEVSWSADHRVIDGMTAALFSNAVKAYLENPSSMLLETR